MVTLSAAITYNTIVTVDKSFYFEQKKRLKHPKKKLKKEEQGASDDIYR